MRKILKSLAILLAVFGIFYLLGSFIQTSFNFKEWTQGARILTSIFSMGFWFFLIAVIYDEL